MRPLSWLPSWRKNGSFSLHSFWMRTLINWTRKYNKKYCFWRKCFIWSNEEVEILSGNFLIRELIKLFYSWLFPKSRQFFFFPISTYFKFLTQWLFLGYVKKICYLNIFFFIKCLSIFLSYLSPPNWPFFRRASYPASRELVGRRLERSAVRPGEQSGWSWRRSRKRRSTASKTQRTSRRSTPPPWQPFE